jgi:2-polyprenyl-3-methyl-5-hydroxy-6-metoxy-1,4-benzoquinol methylase
MVRRKGGLQGNLGIPPPVRSVGVSNTVAMADHHADGTCRWWHLSRPSPELICALSDGWLPPGGRAVDIGCGLGSEAGHLASAGWQVAGIEVSEVAIAAAAAGHD